MFRSDGTLGRAIAARFFAAIGQNLIVEFVPKSDSQVRRLLTTREDIFPDYTQECFEAAFRTRFDILSQTRIAESERTLYLMQTRA